MPHKTALVLAGGGVTGAVYELGALRALEELLVRRTANDFDIYVGTSAGAIIGSLLANGIPAETLSEIMANRHPSMRGLRHTDVFNWNSRGLARWALGLPGQFARAGAASLRQRSLAPLLRAVSAATPPGLYDGTALARYLSQVYTRLGGTDRFDELARELFVVTTCLDTGERAVFGPKHAPGEASISMAVAASTALPFLYAPVQLGEAWYADGGLRGNASVDVAIEQGARLVLCINPLVPYAGQPDQGEDPPADAAWRSMRISSHAALHYHLKHLRRRHPEVDILLIEPHAEDAALLNAPLMDFSARQALFEHGCRAVRQHLADHYAEFEAVLSRHGLRLRPPAGQDRAERTGAASLGTTADRRPAPGAVAWPRRAQSGHTGAQPRQQPGWQTAFDSAPVSAKGETRHP